MRDDIVVNSTLHKFSKFLSTFQYLS